MNEEWFKLFSKTSAKSIQFKRNCKIATYQHKFILSEITQSQIVVDISQSITFELQYIPVQVDGLIVAVATSFLVDKYQQLTRSISK